MTGGANNKRGGGGAGSKKIDWVRKEPNAHGLTRLDLGR